MMRFTPFKYPTLRHVSIFKTCIYLSLALVIIACGSEPDGNVTTEVEYRGLVVDSQDTPIPGALVFVYETGEAGTTTADGRFEIDSFKQISSVGFYLQLDKLSKVVRIDGIPETAKFVSLTIVHDITANSSSVKSVRFADQAPVATPTSVPESGETPKAGNFDSDGNTSAFGIPMGMSGNISRGRSAWSRSCASCHLKEKGYRSFNTIENSMTSIPQMRGLSSLSRNTLADLTAYLNRGQK